MYLAIDVLFTMVQNFNASTEFFPKNYLQSSVYCYIN